MTADSPKEGARVEEIAADLRVAERPETIMFTAEKWRSDACFLLSALDQVRRERDKFKFLWKEGREARAALATERDQWKIIAAQHDQMIDNLEARRGRVK
jgi:hypothetical protein